MRARAIHIAWAAGVAVCAGVAATTGSLSAQQNDGSQAQPSIMVDEKPAVAPPQSPKSKRANKQAPALQRDPNLDAADQLAPSQVTQPMPAAVATPSRAQTTGLAPSTSGPEKASRASPGRLVVACSGAFAKDSSHLKLTMAYDLKNVDFTEVDAGSGKMMASVIYPKDPKRRLEIWWSEPEKRKDTYLIAINGHSTWAGPDGLRLGLSLTELEKLNRKPFKLRGFDRDRVATVTDWDGGSLTAFPGGCKAGVRLYADAKVAADVLAAAPVDREFSSADPVLRAANPAITEIFIGY